MGCVAAVARRLMPNIDIPSHDTLSAEVQGFLMDLPIDLLAAPDLFELLLAGARRMAEPSIEGLLAKAPALVEGWVRERVGSERAEERRLAALVSGRSFTGAWPRCWRAAPNPPAPTAFGRHLGHICGVIFTDSCSMYPGYASA